MAYDHLLIVPEPEPVPAREITLDCSDHEKLMFTKQRSTLPLRIVAKPTQIVPRNRARARSESNG